MQHVVVFVQRLTVDTALFRRTMRDGVWFIWLIALIELVEALHEHKIVAAWIAAP